MILTTHLHPEATPSEVKSYQAKRGQAFKQSKGGRPKKMQSLKKRREKYRPVVEKLAEQGLSSRMIASEINAMMGSDESHLTHKTVCNWLAELRNSSVGNGV